MSLTAADPNAAIIDQTGNSADEAARAYRAHGVVALRDFFAESVIKDLADEADELFVKYRAGEIDESRIAYRPTISGGTIFERLDPVCDIAPACEAISRDARLLELAECLIGGKPYLFKDKLIYKLPGDTGYGLHQDHPYYLSGEIPAGKAVTFAIPIDQVSDEGGGLKFVLGRHDRVQPAPQDNPKDCDPAALAGAPEWNACLGPGSVIAFDTLTPHCSDPNRTDRTRRVLYLTYIDSHAREFRERYYEARLEERGTR